MPAANGRSTVVLALLALALVAHAAPAEAGRHHKAPAGHAHRAAKAKATSARRTKPTPPTRRPKIAAPSRRPSLAAPIREPRPARASKRGPARIARSAAVRTAALAPPPVGDSIGRPWRGRLHGGVRLPQGKGYLIRRPLRSWGTPETVATVRDVLRAVRADHAELHTLAVGDISQKGGGRITEHRSHQSGRDIDIGFFYSKPPAGYPESFAVGTADNLDLGATWDLLTAFARTADQRDGVETIFLDYGVQGLLYEWAKAKGVDQRYLDRLFQYPDGHEGTGLVRHEPHHDDHMHVRFRCPAHDAECK